MISCIHQFIPSGTYGGYEICVNCCSYHSTGSLPYEAVYGSDYWTHERGHSTMAEQVFNTDEFKVNGLSKNEFVIRAIEVECRKDALEIGCAPGTLLRHLKNICGFDEVFGIEASEAFENDLRELGARTANLHFGFFPEIVSDWREKRFDLIIGCDIFEHSKTPEKFLSECARLLKWNGQLLLMGPFPKKGEMLEERFFCSDEHVWLHEQSNLGSMVGEVGLTEVKFNRWTEGHDLISARRRQ